MFKEIEILLFISLLYISTSESVFQIQPYLNKREKIVRAVSVVNY